MVDGGDQTPSPVVAEDPVGRADLKQFDNVIPPAVVQGGLEGREEEGMEIPDSMFSAPLRGKERCEREVMTMN